MKYELKPCPFCGEKLEFGKGASYDKQGYSGPLWKRTDERYRVECPNCHASTDEYRTIKKAVEMWNMRVNDD